MQNLFSYWKWQFEKKKKAIAIRALQEDESLNNFCLKAMKKEIFHSNRSNGLTKGST